MQQTVGSITAAGRDASNPPRAVIANVTTGERLSFSTHMLLGGSTRFAVCGQGENIKTDNC